jgi:hypothetical protein
VPLVPHRLGNGGLTPRRGRVSGPRGERCTQGRVRREDAVRTMVVQAGRWDETSRRVDELQGREPQGRAPIRVGLGEVVDPSMGPGCLQPLQGEWGAQ